MRRVRLTLVASWLGLTSCGDGQADSHYRGEPLLEMRGVVSSMTFNLDEKLEPAIYLGDRTTDPSVERTEFYLMGEVEGTFPNAFTLRIYEPPPDSSLVTMSEGEPKVTLANFTAVPMGHPAWLRFRDSDIILPDGESTHTELCSPDRCISGDYINCPTDAQGQPDPHGPFPCGDTLPDNLPWKRYGRARDHAVFYLAGPTVAGSTLSRLLNGGEAITAGYHVVLFDNEIGKVQQPCLMRADARASDTLAAAYGEQARTWVHDPDHEHEAGPHVIAAYAVEGCSLGYNILKDTTTPVKLDLVDEQAP